MSSPPGDWSVVYDGENDNTRDKLSDDRRTLARTLSIPKSMCILSDTKTETSTVSELVSPKLKLPQLGTDTTERVFPVCSVVSFDSTPSSALQTPSLDKLESPVSPFTDAFWTAALAEEKIAAQSLGVSVKDLAEQPAVSRRPDHLSRMHQQGSEFGSSSSSANVPGVDPTPRSSESKTQTLSYSHSSETPSRSAHPHNALQERESMDVQKPRTNSSNLSDDKSTAIQQFGALLVVSRSDDDLPVRVASGNSEDIMGYSTGRLFEMKTFCNLMTPSHKETFLAHARFVLGTEYDVERSGPEVFRLCISDSDNMPRNLWCTMHTTKEYANHVICELELDTCDSRELSDAISVQGCKEQRASMHDSSASKPQQPRGSRDIATSDALDSAEILNSLPHILQQIAGAQTLEALVQHTVATLQRLTQFDRTTMYHLDGDQNSIIVADAVRENIQSQEATFTENLKDLHCRQLVRLSYSKTRTSSELVYSEPAQKIGLDTSHCYLLGSSVPSNYSTTTPVKAWLSIRVKVFGKLWGFVLCQSYNESAKLHPLLQKVFWILGEAISSNIERLSYTLPFQPQEQKSSPSGANFTQDVQTSSVDLLGLFGANYAAASILGEIKILGKPIDSQEVLALLEYLRAKNLGTVLWSTDITADFQDLSYPPGFHHLSGLLYIPLSADGHDFIILFRADLEEKRDAPDPGGGQDTVNNQRRATGTPSRQNEWSAAEFGKASMLSLLYRTFTEVWQEKEAAMQNNQLMRLLLANSAHEFRTPLNAIINYLEIALDGALNQETRENLSRSHSASKSLIYIINDLLDLTNAENGQKLIKDEVFNLADTLCEATDIFWEEARQKHVDLQVVQHSALPPVLGDQRRVRQVITNLISNAIQHTSAGAVTIESCVPSDCLEPGHILVEVAIHDTGAGISQETVETLFCELEQVSNKGYMQSPRPYMQPSDSASSETESVLGLGLALVARIVRNMNGQLSLKSEEGKGSCFKIRLKFPLPPDGDDQVPVHSTSAPNSQPNGETGTDDLPSNAASCDQAQGQSHSSSDITSPAGNNGITCRCGDPADYGPGQEDASVEIDVGLKTGESKNMVLPVSGTQRDGTPSTERQHTFLKPQDRSQTPSKGSGAHPTHQDLPAPTTQDKKDLDEATKAAFQSPATAQTRENAPQDPKENDNKPQEYKLHILVAEDDPINSTIVKKRLKKLGHSVRMTSNGKECAFVYGEDAQSFDAVLMDLQMPIVDGIGSTKMIREYEQEQSLAKDACTPVFAVSASLVEKDRQTYIDSGFDGWIMKPIDFQRVHTLLGGVKSDAMRSACLYQPGMWEQGGWFQRGGINGDGLGGSSS